jgi:hypothetical protein
MLKRVCKIVACLLIAVTSVEMELLHEAVRLCPNTALN